MRTIFTSLLIGMVLLVGSSMMQAEKSSVQMRIPPRTEEVLQNRVWVFDYQGNLIKELIADEVARGEISVMDYLLLESSHFAFSYFGDQYYLKD